MSYQNPHNRENNNMRYQVRIAGKIFQGTDTRALVRLAVAARREAMKQNPPAVVEASQSPS